MLSLPDRPNLVLRPTDQLVVLHHIERRLVHLNLVVPHLEAAVDRIELLSGHVFEDDLVEGIEEPGAVRRVVGLVAEGVEGAAREGDAPEPT